MTWSCTPRQIIQNSKFPIDFLDRLFKGRDRLADGDLVVFGFDDTDVDDTSKVPDRKFVISKEELQTHYQDSELGPNYYVWIPWDEMGGERKVVSLLPMLKPG